MEMVAALDTSFFKKEESMNSLRPFTDWTWSIKNFYLREKSRKSVYVVLKYYGNLRFDGKYNIFFLYFYQYFKLY